MPIQIIIRDETEGDGTPSQNGGTPTARGLKQEQGKENSLKRQTNAMLIDYGKQILQEGINLYIDYSGNYVLRDSLTAATNIAADALMIAKGGVVGAAAVTFKTINRTIQINREISRANQQSEFLKTQAGKIISMGGRYTND